MQISAFKYFNQISNKSKAICFALLVTILWSSSWVFIKIGLKNIPPLQFAGMRYFLAFCVLIPFVFHFQKQKLVDTLKTAKLKSLLLLGFVMYFLSQGSQFLSLKYFPPMFIALTLNTSPLVIALIQLVVFKQKISFKQFLGILICLFGAFIYIQPKISQSFSAIIGAPDFNMFYFVAPLVCLLSNSASSLLGRHLNKDLNSSSMIITFVSMGFGSLLLLTISSFFESLVMLSWNEIFILLFLAVINTAFAFSLWNYTLKYLSSVESSVINNTMLVQIAILAYIFLDQNISIIDVFALVTASVGAIVVQLNAIKK